MNVTLGISIGLFGKFASLPRRIQDKTKVFLSKLSSDPFSPGLNLEKIKTNKHGLQFYSARIDKEYRGILSKQDDGLFYLLWIDHHDEAYAWAEKTTCALNPKTDVLQLFETDYSEPAAANTEGTCCDSGTALFDDVSDEALLELSVPAELIPRIRSLAGPEELYATKGTIPEDCYENLQWLVEGIPLEEVLEDVRAARASAGSTNSLDNPETLRGFCFIHGEEELEALFAGPLEAWRVFLHPSQRLVVDRDFNGPARVLGSAGTGKTVVAMHRAQRLASQLKGDERVLFTTFSTVLAADILANLKKICSREELGRIEVNNLDSWVASFISRSSSCAIEYDEAKLKKTWALAIKRAGIADAHSPEFYYDEWRLVVMAVSDSEPALSSYVHAKRRGRGTRLGRKERLEVWKVVEAYQQILAERKVYDVDSAMALAIRQLKAKPGGAGYKHIIVDEGQDFSPIAYRLLRAMAGDEHPNDLFIVGDPQQRIYGRQAVLSQCGVNIRGRSSILRINYRTTEEIRRRAAGMLQGLPIDDLDGGEIGDVAVQSLIHGVEPRIEKCTSFDEEMCAVLKSVEGVEETGGYLKDVCVVARSNRIVDEVCAALTAAGKRSLKLKGSKADDRNAEGIRVATMHRVKGLEFDYVILVEVNDGIIPPRPAMTEARENGTAEQLIHTERSLLYVALTRAKKEVLVLYSGRPSMLLG